jgi:hypothetical protein
MAFGYGYRRAGTQVMSWAPKTWYEASTMQSGSFLVWSVASMTQTTKKMIYGNI